MYQLYKITNNINGKIYIGQTKNAQKRWKQHQRKAKLAYNSSNMILYSAIRKHRIDNFSFEIIASAQTIDDANAAEILLIQQYDCHISNGKGYNVSLGGARDNSQIISQKRKGQHNSPQTEFKKGHKNKNVLRGEKHAKAKLNNSQVLQIVQLHKQNKSRNEISQLLNISTDIICRVLIGKTWSHITGIIHIPGANDTKFKPNQKSWNKGLHITNSGTFTKGHIPWSKGTKGLKKASSGSFTAGENHRRAKLTEQQVLEIVNLSAQGVTQKEIAQQFEITRAAVAKIMQGRSWSQLTGIKIKS